MKIHDSKSSKEDEVVGEIMQWAEKNSKDPEYKENEHLIRIEYKFLEGNVAKMKKFIVLYREKRSEVFSQYDKYENIYENLRHSYNTVAGGILPEKSTFGHSVVIAKVLDCSNEIDFMDLQMRALLFAETVQQNDLLGKKVILVLDYTGIQLSFLFKLNIFAIQRAYKTWKDFAFLSCSEIHHINMPLHSYYVMNLCNAIMEEKLKKVNYYHTGNLAKFYEHVPQEIMPKEYGGNAPEIVELSEMWYEETMKRCNPIIEHFKTLAEKTKKPKKSSHFYEIPFKLLGKLRKKPNAA